MTKKSTVKRVEDDPRYHDTWQLLKKYRDVVWSLELSVQQLKKQFELEYGSSIEDFLESVYLAGADLGGTQIEDHARCIERSQKMLSLLDRSVELLRTRHKNGEEFYWILYFTYLSPSSSKTQRRSSNSSSPTCWTSVFPPTIESVKRLWRLSVPFFGDTPHRNACKSSTNFIRQEHLNKANTNATPLSVDGVDHH